MRRTATYVLTVLENLVLGKSCDPLLEVAVADAQYGPLLVQKRHARGQHRHLVLQAGAEQTDGRFTKLQQHNISQSNSNSNSKQATPTKFFTRGTVDETKNQKLFPCMFLDLWLQVPASRRAVLHVRLNRVFWNRAQRVRPQQVSRTGQ